jgi:hypothetical protein
VSVGGDFAPLADQNRAVRAAMGLGKAKRGRPRKAPATPPPPDRIAGLVAELRTEAGQERALASIIDRARAGGLTRDEVSALTVEKHCVAGFRAFAKDRDQEGRIADLEASLAELHQAMAGKKGSALRADAAVVPPSLTEVEDQIGADMAASPGGPRGGKPYQS